MWFALQRVLLLQQPMCHGRRLLLLSLLREQRLYRYWTRTILDNGCIVTISTASVSWLFYCSCIYRSPGLLASATAHILGTAVCKFSWNRKSKREGEGERGEKAEGINVFSYFHYLFNCFCTVITETSSTKHVDLYQTECHWLQSIFLISYRLFIVGFYEYLLRQVEWEPKDTSNDKMDYRYRVCDDVYGSKCIHFVINIEQVGSYRTCRFVHVCTQ